MTTTRFLRTGVVHRRALVLAALLAVTAVSLAGASAAAAKSPTGDFAVFSQCPRFSKGVNLCLFVQSKSGEATLNKQKVPIVNTITLQGGIERTEEEITEEEIIEHEKFVGALNGETLSKTPQPVPGGLLGLVPPESLPPFLKKLFEEFINKGITGVNATTELAKPASEIGISKNNLVNQEGVALSLPVKIHLENLFLGSSCYVGSSSHPLIWNLTTGTTSPPPPNKPITGKVGEISFKDEFTFTEITNNTVLDNAYSAPEATGCGGIFAFLIDPIIDAKIGLPSAAGKNTTVLNNTVKEASGEAVIKSEK